MIEIALILIFVHYSALEGIREGFYYHAQPDTRSFNLHYLFVIQRALFGLLILYISRDWVFCVGLVLIFSLFHNGFYFITRNKLNPEIYKKGFFSNSTTSTAFFEFSFPVRLILAVLGIAAILFNL